MKNLVLIIITILLCNLTSLFSQPCLPEGITFTSQEEIDNFQVNYPNCTEIEGDVAIGTASGTNITNLNGLSLLTSFGGSLFIGYNDFLENLSGLENLITVGSGLTIHDNDALISLTGLNNVTTIGGGLSIGSNGLLENLTALENLTSIQGPLYIGNTWGNLSGNNSLIDLTGLNNLNAIEGNLTLSYNEALTSLSGLNNVSGIAGNFSIEGNPSLTGLMDINNLTSISGDLEITGNDALTSITGLNNVTSIEGSLTIYENDVLINLTGLENVASLIDIVIESNVGLTSLIGLNNINYLEGSIWISANHSLTSLEGLNNINPGSIENLNIQYNDSLSTCHVQSICDYLASPNGTTEIHDNAVGCNTPEEVQEACENTFVDEASLAENLIIYPNPFRCHAKIEFFLQDPGMVNLGIYDITGKAFQTLTSGNYETGKHNFIWQAEEIQSGIYFLKLETKHTVYIHKALIFK